MGSDISPVSDRQYFSMKTDRSVPFSAPTGLSNSLFQDCEQTSTPSLEYGGGAVRMYSCSFQQLSYVQLRDCSSANERGHDIYLINTLFGSDSFSTCDSTSSSTHRVTISTTDFSNLLANPEFEARVRSGMYYPCR
ncbi:hypothetical protein BLNAU_1634 [Blattamonas nauphoetae]|uniref:Uncharacterized protein n=1 Tax=Blattamonas nauphoetae TaxID=2049346 RepID=A0ABQ9YIU7_9EUKA|nr:hypothetical protein BLNAU_1634 [Blattamonas nauphoetae]